MEHTMIRLHLFGPPGFSRDGETIHLDTRKAIALAAYLVLSSAPQARERLAAFLWPNSEECRARGALRRTLCTLRTLVDEESLNVDRDRIALRPGPCFSCDVWDFQHALLGCDVHAYALDGNCESCIGKLRGAIALFGDGFLAGFSLKDSAEYDDWQSEKAEQLRWNYVWALDLMVAWECGARRWDAAIELARLRLEADRLDEAAHRQLMLLYAVTGARTAAVQQFQRCVRILNHEVGVPPLADTVELYERICAGRLHVASDSPNFLTPATERPQLLVAGLPPV